MGSCARKNAHQLDHYYVAIGLWANWRSCSQYVFHLPAAIICEMVNPTAHYIKVKPQHG